MTRQKPEPEHHGYVGDHTDRLSKIRPHVHTLRFGLAFRFVSSLQQPCSQYSAPLLSYWTATALI